MVEQVPFKHKEAGSIPAGPTRPETENPPPLGFCFGSFYILLRGHKVKKKFLRGSKVPHTWSHLGSETIGESTTQFVTCPGGGMADAEDSKSSVVRRVGSSPTLGTNSWFEGDPPIGAGGVSRPRGGAIQRPMEKITKTTVETVISVLNRPRFKTTVFPEFQPGRFKVEAFGFNYEVIIFGTKTKTSVFVSRDSAGELRSCFFMVSFYHNMVPNLRKIGITLANKIKMRPIYEVMKD